MDSDYSGFARCHSVSWAALITKEGKKNESNEKFLLIIVETVMFNCHLPFRGDSN